jgi:hypothetical protein
VPAFLKNIALASEGLVDVGMVSNPRDDLLTSFRVTSLPDIVVVYDTPEDMRTEAMPEGQKTLLGQAVYNAQEMGPYNFENVMRYVMTVMSQTHNPGLDTINMR